MINKTTSTLFLALAVLACSGGELAGGSGKVGGPSESKPAPGEEDDENERAGIPAQVSGAFLTCGVADDYTPQDGDAEPIGCAMMRGSDKLPGAVTVAEVSLEIEGGATVTPESSIAPDGSPWHVHFAVPKSVKAKVRQLNIVLGVGNNVFRFGKPIDPRDWNVRVALDPKEREDDDSVVELDDVTLSPPKPPLDTGTPGEDDDGGEEDDGSEDDASVDADIRHVLFVTSRQYRPGTENKPDDFIGALRAASYCKALAAAAGLAQTEWIALISDRDRSLKQRVPPLKGDVGSVTNQPLILRSAPFKLIGNMVLDEKGNEPPLGARVWTGSKNNGDIHGSRCSPNWDSGSPSERGRVGNPRDKGKWLDVEDRACGTNTGANYAHLYCLSL